MLRHIKLLLFLLVLSNVAVGSFAFYSVRALDQKYSALLSRSVPALSDLQTLTAHAVEAMLRTNPSAIAGQPVHGEMIERARQAVQSDEEFRTDLIKRGWLAGHAEEQETFQRAGAEFTRTANDFIDAMPSLSIGEGYQRRQAAVRPSFERYLAAMIKIADAVETDSLQARDALTSHAGSVSRVILAVGNWPVVLLLLIPVLFLCAVIILLVTSWNSLAVGRDPRRT